MNDLFEISKRGLLTAQQANATIGHNIANANTDGYSRQRLVVGSIDIKKNGFSYGLGVRVNDIQRMRNEMLDGQIYRAQNQMGGLQTKATVLEQIEGLMISGGADDLDIAIDNFFNSLSDLSNTPQDKNLRKIVVTKAESMTRSFRNVHEGLKELSDGTRIQAENDIQQINSLIADLAQLNKSISLSKAQGTTDHNAKDIQVQKLQKLAGLIDAETRTDKNGALEIRIDGILILSSDKAIKLTSQVDTLNGRYHVRLENGKAVIPREGQLAANIELYEETIPGLLNNLDTLAQALVTEVNAIHRTGYGLNDTVLQTRDFFDPAGVTAEDIRIHTSILSDPSNIAASSMQEEAANNDVLLELVGLRDKPVLNDRSFNFNATRLISRPGIELGEIETQLNTKRSELTMLENQQESISGVNLDEEVTNLIMFQNVYQASARVLGAAQEMYNTLLSII